MGICRGILVFRSGPPQRLSTAQFGLRRRRTGQTLGLILATVLAGTGTITRADPLDAALASAERPAADRERDASSRPAAVLRFFGIPSGGVAVDLFAGGGYYSEILSRAMGAGSTVYMHNNAAYLGFAGEAADERTARNRLPGVIRYDRELDAIDLADDSVDLVLMVMTYHDLYYKTDGWDLDPESFFTTVHRILKPGGTLAIVDHVAKPGTGATAAQDLHRIDPAFARQDIESRGFEFVGESDLLANADDPLTASVFDPSIRGNTA
ncbi:MAG: methyltransferase domain-containing protein, partial [Pirellulales bacterium]|nr:methyltransferase domain-containing protein [Pirellulales bacterium]